MAFYLTDILTRLAEREPKREILHLLFADRPTESITASQLDRDARQIAATLEEQGVAPGEILPLVFDHSYELIAAFWGAIYLGAVPTILPYLSAETRTKDYFVKVQRLAQFVHAEAIVTSQDLQSYLVDGLANSGCRILTLHPLMNELLTEHMARYPRRAGSNLPYIQFSSGTTGTPKGVMLTHDALLHYLKISAQAQLLSTQDVCVGWLPLYHDMGLVNQILSPFFNGYPGVLMSPTDWLRQPQRLFEAIHKYRGTVTWMPNFAFRYCARRVRDEQLVGLDLSSWRLIGNGSEPVQSQDLQAFADRFGPYGVRPDALRVSYGLAEHVAGLTFSRQNAVPEVDWVSEKELGQQKALRMEPHTSGSRPIVSCGFPMSSVSVRIVNDAGEDLPEREVGNVLVSSPCVFSGYYLLPEESARVMSEGWFNTEDLGYLANGQLYICGRKKDLIIVGGRNIHPTQLEAIVESCVGQQCRFAAAFGVPNLDLGTEMPVVVCEMRELPDDATRARLQQEIREQVQQSLQLFVSDVYWVKPGWILKTTSGKINRRANRDKYLEAQAQPQLDAAPHPNITIAPAYVSDTERQLIRIWQRLFKQTTIQTDDNFFALGGDSLLAVQMMLEIENQFQSFLSEAILIQAPTISRLAAVLDRSKQPAMGQLPIPLQPVSAQSRHPIFYCVHNLGGGLLTYKPLVEALGAAQPVYGLQPPGLNGELKSYDTIPEMALHFVEAIKRMQPHGPYYVGGHSFGGIVAFEIVCQLTRIGERVELLALFDTAAPLENVQAAGVTHRLRSAIYFGNNLPYWLRDYVRTGRYKIRSDNRRVLGLFSKQLLRFSGGKAELTAQDVISDVSLVPARHLSIAEKQMAALYQYLPTPYNGRLVLFRTKVRSLQSPERDMGWQRLTTGPLEIQFVAGSHSTMLTEPNVHDLAAKLSTYLVTNAHA